MTGELHCTCNFVVNNRSFSGILGSPPSLGGLHIDAFVFCLKRDVGPSGHNQTCGVMCENMLRRRSSKSMY